MINLDDMFDKCVAPNSFLRVDSSFKNDIYVGYNELMQKTLVVVGNSKQTKVMSTNSIEVSITERTDGRVSLNFVLVEEVNHSVFYKFCEDIILNSNNVQNKRVITHTMSRWYVWRALFEKTKNGLLSKEKIQGLVGELLFLNFKLENNENNYNVIESWTGPDSNPKDFYFDNLWYEIKTISSSKQSVNISSIEQLDSDDLGYLVVVRLQNTTKQQHNHITLNSIILKVTTRIKDIEALNLFYDKLSIIGYSYDDRYDEECYEYKKTDIYCVDKDFPRIKRISIPKDIISVSYGLSLTGLEKEREVKWNC